MCGTAVPLMILPWKKMASENQKNLYGIHKSGIIAEFSVFFRAEFWQPQSSSRRLVWWMVLLVKQ